MQKNIKSKVRISEERNIPTHVVAVFAVIRKKNKFLLVKRSSGDPQAGGAWSIPGGKVEAEEGWDLIENTLKREIREETGLEVGNHFEFLGSEGFIRVSGHHVVGLVFLADWKSGIAKPLEDHEEVKWVTIDEFKNMKDLPDYMLQRVKQLENYLRVEVKHSAKDN